MLFRVFPLSALRVRKCPGSKAQRPEGCKKELGLASGPPPKGRGRFSEWTLGKGGSAPPREGDPIPSFLEQETLRVPCELVTVNGTVQSRK